MNRPWNSGNSGVPIDDHGHSQNRKPSPGGEPRDIAIGAAQFVSENAPNALSEPARTQFARARFGVKTYSKPTMP